MEKNYFINHRLKKAGLAAFLMCCTLQAGSAFAQSRKVDMRTKHEGTMLGAILNLFHKEEVAPQRLITGRIKSEGFSGLPYVRMEGADFVSEANYDGDFIISVPQEETKLIIGAPGLEEQVLNLDDDSHYNIILRVKGGNRSGNQPSIYGMNIDRRRFNGAYTTLTAQDIRIRNSSTLDEVLVGSVPGLTATGLWKGVATNFRFTIRGRGSLMSSTSPLVVLDGAPYSGALNTINPNDVQYITVLRDAAGKAAYGSRGANGIILITTKRGDSYME